MRSLGKDLKNSGFDAPRSNDGFTLLEVMVALIIIGLFLGSTFQSISQSKRISWRSSEVIEAVRIANNLLADSALIEKAIKEKEIEDDIKGEDGWRYTISVSPLELKPDNAEQPSEIPSMVKLRLCQVYQSGQREKSFCLTRWYRSPS